MRMNNTAAQAVAVTCLVLAGPTPEALHGQGISVDGVIESTAGGFVFPDGSKALSAMSVGIDHLLTVSASGAEYPTIGAALDAIGSTLPGATIDDPYVISVGPGVYAEKIAMKSWVLIEGAGQGLTTVTATGGTALDAATVLCTTFGALRGMTIVNTGGESLAAGLGCLGGSSILTDLEIEVSGASSENYGLFLQNDASTVERITVSVSGSPSGPNYGLFASGGSAQVAWSAFEVSGEADLQYGVYGSGASVDLDRVEITVSGAALQNRGVYNEAGGTLSLDGGHVLASTGTDNFALWNFDADATVRNSHLSVVGGGSQDAAVFNLAAGTPTARVVSIDHSLLDAPVSVNGGTSFTNNLAFTQMNPVSGPGLATCFSTWDPTHTALDASCQ
jgi:hypothetical protein